jgi:hypothetical protein
MTDKQEPEYYLITPNELFLFGVNGVWDREERTQLYDVVKSRPYHPAPEQRYKIVESVPKNGIIILGIKEDPDGAFVSRKMALVYIEREYQIRQEARQSEREKSIEILQELKGYMEGWKRANLDLNDVEKGENVVLDTYIPFLDRKIESLRKVE